MNPKKKVTGCEVIWDQVNRGCYGVCSIVVFPRPFSALNRSCVNKIVIQFDAAWYWHVEAILYVLCGSAY